MAREHGISWLNVPGRIGETWNPVIGCSPVSEGCKNCYAARMAKRLWGMDALGTYAGLTTGGVYNGKIARGRQLGLPAAWRKPRFCFVCSMGDFCHEAVPQEWNDDVLRTIAAGSVHHRYAFLTKRPERMAGVVEGWGDLRDRIILGTSIENQKTADERLPHLLELAAQGWQTMVSYEPALGPVDFGFRNEPRIDWLVIGGETGPGARACDVEWIHSAAGQAAAAGVRCFVKALGSQPLCSCTAHEARCVGGLSDSRGAIPSEWPEDLQRVREWPEFLTDSGVLGES